jgi:type 1 glutamine amidotransferase
MLLLHILLLILSRQVFGQEERIPVLLITSGHDFDRDVFFEMMDGFESLEITEVKHPDANNFWLDESIQEFKAVIFYDMVQEISTKQMEGFEKVVNDGIGLVFLHHSIVSYQNWDFFHDVLGGIYLEPAYFPSNHSDYKHEEYFNVIIKNNEHPITGGVQDFKVFDEIYINVKVNDEVKILAATDHPISMEPLIWFNEVNDKTRSVYIQPGHGPVVFADHHYRKLLLNSIIWASQKN